MKLNSVALFLLLVVSVVFSQEAQEPIKFQVPENLNGVPTVTQQQLKPNTAAQNVPLNLSVLTAADSENFQDYSQRYILMEDSISAIRKAIETAKNKAETELPPPKPKGEFEKQADYDARASKWNTDVAARIEKDTKALNSRLAELESAKAKILKNQTSLYASIDIKSNPSDVFVWLGKEKIGEGPEEYKIGATPVEYKLLIPGTVKIRLQKEGYNPWDSTLQVAPRAKLKLDVVLEEKSIFSQKNEINFSQILSKDTTVQGYEARIKMIEARQTEINNEIKLLLENFQNSYPALEPKKEGETSEEFEKRREKWTKEGTLRFVELQKKHEAYNRKLSSSIAVLNDYIIATQSSLLKEIAMTAKINLGTYDSEGETFELVAQDTANRKSPFYFNGKVGVPLNMAKDLNRNIPGFVAGLQFINFPFNTDSASVNLAMSGLQLSMNGQDLKVSGSFSEIERYKSMEGYKVWKLRADSLLSGKLKADGLGYSYAMNTAAKDVVASDVAKNEEAKGLGWRGITRIIAFSAAAVFGAASVYRHLESSHRLNELESLKTPFYDDNGSTDVWEGQYNAKADEINDKEKQRNMFGALAGVCAFYGVVTFFF
jgi:hypothetical protein